ncbi:hypothetical protein BACERE00185_03563 [Bacillus mobilis]|uniref:Uncharacterized protein n=1 Tax=Bacillus mobilis TaxID=2026190 RepID=A0A1Y6A8I5_9BACI|nr:hypothetical protein BACERE00185_03563 [Bacillus mobilis]
MEIKKDGYSNRTIMNAFNREIISYFVSELQTLALAMKTLKQAM